MLVKMKETLENLAKNGFDARFAEDINAAKRIVMGLIPNHATVGVADSSTARQIGILEELDKKRIRILNPFSKELTTDSTMEAVRDDMLRQVFLCDILITGSNALTRDGKLVNVDAVGNRVASMIFGPKRVFILLGKNKIVKNVDEGLYRIKNIIAPFHARTKKIVTPCAQIGKCVSCKAARRICNVTTIMESKPWKTEMVVILVNEDLGLSWDQTWSKKRIDRIKRNYKNVTWVFGHRKRSRRAALV